MQGLGPRVYEQICSCQPSLAAAAPQLATANHESIMANLGRAAKWRSQVLAKKGPISNCPRINMQLFALTTFSSRKLCLSLVLLHS